MTLWAREEVVCPLCNAPNTFSSIVSWGSYIYFWPSKYQFIFWPYTEGKALYCCKNCYLTCFMWDFAQLPTDKAELVRKQLEGTELHAQEYAYYTDIPMTQRLAIAERVYTVLGRDDEFWCHFWRVVGYHCAREGRPDEAAQARLKALGLAEKRLPIETNVLARKELLLICGAMRYFLNDFAGAKADFLRALQLKMEGSNGDENAAGKDNYLTELLTEYVAICDDPELATSLMIPDSEGDTDAD